MSQSSRQVRLGVAAVVALLTMLLHAVGTASAGYTGDLDQVWHAARAVLAGLDPYAEAGNQAEWGFPLYYPLPAILAALPLALLPLALARTLFIGLSTFLLAYALTREGPHRLWIFMSGAFLGAVAATQWSPLMTAALLLPLLAPLLVVKPNLGLAFAAAGPGRTFYLAGLAGGGTLLAVSFAVDPLWVGRWWQAIQVAPHINPPVLLPGGFLVLAALLRWRRWDARLLVGMACVPHTTLAYEALPLLLIARGRAQTMLLSGLSLLVLVAQFAWDTRLPLDDPGALDAFASWARSVGTLSVWLLYLPATIIVLRRREEPERFGRWKAGPADEAVGTGA